MVTDVAETRRAFDRNQRRALLGERREAAFDVLVGNVRRLAFDRQTFVVAQHDLRAHLDRRL